MPIPTDPHPIPPMLNERCYVSVEMLDALKEQTRALAAALGIVLPEEFSLAQTRFIMANAVPRTIPLGGARVPGDREPVEWEYLGVRYRMLYAAVRPDGSAAADHALAFPRHLRQAGWRPPA